MLNTWSFKLKENTLYSLNAEPKIPRIELKIVKNQRLISSKTIIWRSKLKQIQNKPRNPRGSLKHPHKISKVMKRSERNSA